MCPHQGFLLERPRLRHCWHASSRRDILACQEFASLNVIQLTEMYFTTCPEVASRRLKGCRALPQTGETWKDKAVPFSQVDKHASQRVRTSKIQQPDSRSGASKKTPQKVVKKKLFTNYQRARRGNNSVAPGEIQRTHSVLSNQTES